MSSIYCAGGCGDSYIYLLKTLHLGKIDILHNVKQEYYKPIIQQIYDFNPNITLSFTDVEKEDITSDTHEGDMNFFPEFEFEYWISDKYDPYVVIQPHSGKDKGHNRKDFGLEYTQKIVDYFKSYGLGSVILGTDSKYENLERCCGKFIFYKRLPLSQIYYIIRNSTHFVGPEGLLSFMALSCKVKSNIFYSQYEAIEKRIVGTPWENYVNEFTKLEDVCQF